MYIWDKFSEFEQDLLRVFAWTICDLESSYKQSFGYDENVAWESIRKGYKHLCYLIDNYKAEGFQERAFLVEPLVELKGYYKESFKIRVKSNLIFEILKLQLQLDCQLNDDGQFELIKSTDWRNKLKFTEIISDDEVGQNYRYRNIRHLLKYTDEALM